VREVAAATTPDAASRPLPLETSRKRHSEIICVVDDNPSVRKSISRFLETSGLEVQTFSGPVEFLRFLETNPVALAILDIWMEHMTGMELLAHLCARSPQTRAIFITGHDDPAAAVTVRQAGAFAFLVKPFDHEELLRLVHQALGHSEAPA
jgi:FixJ family two-component response regulator